MNTMNMKADQISEGYRNDGYDLNQRKGGTKQRAWGTFGVWEICTSLNQ